jgi:glycogen debranching enzyme
MPQAKKGTMAENTVSLTDDLTRVLNHADTFAVFNRWGDIIPGSEQLHGVYFLGMRHLSTYGMTINGKRGILLNSALESTHESMDVHLINHRDDDSGLPRGQIHVHRRLKLTNGLLEEETVLHNYGSFSVDLRIAYEMQSDYKDLFEIRGFSRDGRGKRLEGHSSSDFFESKYLGRDDIIRCSNVKIKPDTSFQKENGFGFDFSLEPNESHTLEIKMFCTCEEESWSARSKLKLREFDFIEIDSDNEVFNRWLTRSKTDLYSLIAPTCHGHYIYAGIPWFNTAFGRDGLISAYFTLWMMPDLTRDVLKLLAATQALEENPENDAEPGKILHEMRTGEMANTGEVPFGKYYGSVDSTPLFIFLAGQYYRRTRDTETLEKIFPAIERALDWMRDYGDQDGDGFLEYHKSSERGLYNQGWKDADDAVSHASGEIAESPLALCEIQAYAYAAYCEAAFLYRVRGENDRSRFYEKEADKLKNNFNERFWDDELQCFVIALDKDKNPCLVKSSNSGQCLAFGIADGDKRDAHMKSLFSADLHTGWGIRTLGEKAGRYNPISYHNGSVWPHDNAIIGYGLAKNGFKEEANSLFHSLFSLCEHYEDRRLPELFCGFSRQIEEGPVHYPVACSPQAWAVTSIYHFIRGSLGLEFDAAEMQLTFHQPELPSFLDRLSVKELSLGSGELDFTVSVAGGKSQIVVERNTSNWKIIVEK